MRPPDESNGDEIAARRLFDRLDEALRAAAKGRWSTAKRTRNNALLNFDSEDRQSDRQPPSVKSMEGDRFVAPHGEPTSSNQEEDSSG
jgi:hypothetical protein